MANTEGMPDEAIESLFFSGIGNENIDNRAAARRRRILEERMEMSMGDRPAARVIRTSRNNNVKRQPSQEDSRNKKKEPTSTPPPIIGSIVERTKASQPQSASSDQKKRQSKFAQQRLQSGPVASATGFPSTNVPLGTFVKPKKKSETPSTSLAAKARAIQPGASLGLSLTSQSIQSTALSILDSAAKEADAMLAQMSPEERMEKAQELQAALSPETILFLKKRAASKAKQAGGIGNKKGDSKGDTTTTTYPDHEEFPLPKEEGKTDQPNILDDSFEEKQRIAKVLANIKTVADLDSAFQREIGDYSPLQSSEISPELAKQAQEDPFPLACTLLRSTVPRQNLWAAQIVSKRLKDQWQRGDLCSLIPMEEVKFRNQTPWPYPIMLPASLRCLLDSSVSHTNGYVLHTYVLQSIYNLMRLRACVDHVVDVDIDASTSASTSSNLSALYQTHFLEDAVPTQPIGSVYESFAHLEAVSGTEDPTSVSGAAAYKTSSSSKSAQKDGEAFAKDPMWALLSRMCIIPRLVQLLRIAAQTSREHLVPKEALVAICGILAMISQRSPGAATAIVHHQTLLQHLTEVTVTARDNSEQPYDPFVAFPAVRLLCALGRQSRTAAERIPFDDIVPPILAMKAKSAQESELQKWGVIFWRVLLRYGLGLSSIQTMITIAASHIALGPVTSPYSLTTEFASSFANILQCLQVGRRHLSRVESTDEECAIPKDSFDTMSNADLWLSSSAKQAMTHLEKTSEAQLSDSIEIKLQTEYMRFNAGHLQFLAAFLRTSQEDVRLSTFSNGEFKQAELELSETWIRSCQQVLSGCVENGLLDQAFGFISPTAFAMRLDEMPTNVGETTSTVLQREASSCSFLCSFVSLQMYLLAKIMNEDGSTASLEAAAMKDSVRFVVSRFTSILNVYSDYAVDKTTDLACSGGAGGFPIARRGWLNRACFAILELLNSAKDFDALPSTWGPRDAELLRSLQFTLIGRLERGDEAMAVLLLSQDSHFQSQKNTGNQHANGESATLSSMFFREMCRTSNGRVQLDHSFKLKHGPGITAEEVGAFGLRSLLSDIDLPGKDDGDILLPMGMLWLWQVLSSPTSAHTKEHVIPEDAGREMESINILSSALDLILYLEEGGEMDACFYAANIPAGAKAYHLMNVCLQPETTLQNETLARAAEELMDIYRGKMDEQFGLEFAKACALHSDAAKKKQAADSKDKDLSKTEKMASKLLEGPGSGWKSLGEKDIRTLVDFTGELCEAYIEYGAQYDLFTSCVRSFSHPTFPSRVRCQAVSRLGEVLNRISLRGEDDATSETGRERLESLLQNSIAGSLPSVDGSARDPPEFLDSVSSLYKGGSSPICFGYSFLFHVLVQARHLAICAQPDAAGFDAAKKRVLTLNPDFTSVVVDATKRFLKSSGHGKIQLVNAVLDAGLFWESNKKLISNTGDNDETNLADLLESLKTCV